MNKHALIGMVMLVGLVLTKAIISLNEETASNVFNRGDETYSNLLESAELRSDLGASGINAALQFMASAFTTPSFENLESDNQIIENVEAATDLVATTSNQDRVDEEIRPLESYSNTGYGMWMGSSDDTETNEESAPLDGGNTISDQMSRLFPINLND